MRRPQPPRELHKALLLLWVLASIGGCGPTGDVVTPYFSAQRHKIFFEVAYMEGAEPLRMENASNGVPTDWRLLQTNIAALFSNTKEIEIQPTGAWQKIPGQQKTYSAKQVLAVANQYRRTSQVAGSISSIFVLFVDGPFDGGGYVGKSYEDRGVIALSMPELRAALDGQSDSWLHHLVQQHVLIHEAGHALGLVNWGIDALAEHEDTEHRSHCTNPQCVMHWDLSAVYFKSNPFARVEENILFGPECLQDAAAVLNP